MKRKTFINRLVLGGGSIVLLPSISVMQGCEYRPVMRTALTEADIPFLDELAETILPPTDASAGAKAAKVGQYILLMYNDCMEAGNQAIFLEGINDLDNRSAKVFSGSFLNADSSQKLQLLETAQAEAIAHNLKQEGMEEPIPHYFDILKGLTISGYFTSEIGMTEAREYLPVPGKFEACIPYNQGDKPWAM